MTAGLETFAKVRALRDRTDSPGEKAAAASRMEALARAAGMTMAEAVSKLDTPPPPRSIFEDLFNTPEFRAQRAEREQRDADHRATVLAEVGSEDAVWAEIAWEIALETACRPVVVRKPIIGGEMDTLMGWDGGQFDKMPPAVHAAVSGAYPLPSTVREAWAEFAAWEKLTGDRCAFWSDYSPDVRTRARTEILEHLLDTLPAGDVQDLRARLDWMQHVLDLGFSRDVREDQACLTALRADIERMAVQFGQAPVQAAGGEQDRPEGHTGRHGPLTSPDPGTSNTAAQTGQRPSTRAERRAAARALLAEGLTDREIARRLGISPTTVGALRKGSGS